MDATEHGGRNLAALAAGHDRPEWDFDDGGLRPIAGGEVAAVKLGDLATCVEEESSC